MKVHFLSEGFPGLTEIDWRVTECAWQLPGGSATARLEADLPRRMDWDWERWLTCPVVIRDNAGEMVWGGFVSTVHLQMQGYEYAISIDSLVNRVKARYKRFGFSNETGEPWLETAWFEEERSIARFGIREKLLTFPDNTPSLAAAVAEAVLNRFAFPTETTRLMETSTQVHLILNLRGWWERLAWRLDAEQGGRIGHFAGKSRQPVGLETNQARLAQSFEVQEAGFRCGVFGLCVSLVGNPLDELVCRICADESGEPGDVLAEQSIPTGEMSGAWGWFSLNLNPPVTLDEGVRYWLVVQRSGLVDENNYYLIKTDDGPGLFGETTLAWNGSFWVPVNESLCFALLAVSPVQDLIHTIIAKDRGGFYLNNRRILFPGEVDLPVWRELGLNCAERLAAWLELMQADGFPYSAVVTPQHNFDLFPLPVQPQLPLSLTTTGKLNRVCASAQPSLGKLVNFAGRRRIITKLFWTAQAGYQVVESTPIA